MFTFGGFGIWWIIDMIFVTHCWMVDVNGRTLVGCPELDSPIARMPPVKPANM